MVFRNISNMVIHRRLYLIWFFYVLQEKKGWTEFSKYFNVMSPLVYAWFYDMVNICERILWTAMGTQALPGSWCHLLLAVGCFWGDTVKTYPHACFALITCDITLFPVQWAAQPGGDGVSHTRPGPQSVSHLFWFLRPYAPWMEYLPMAIFGVSMSVTIPAPGSIWDMSDMFHAYPIFLSHVLVGGFNSSEKYESVGMIINNIWENKKCSKPPTRR